MVSRWMGPRFYLSTQRCLDPGTLYTSIVSSQLGRDNRRLTNWPEILNATLQDVDRHGSRLLLVAETTLYEAARQFAQKARLPIAEVILPEGLGQDSQEIIPWLSKNLSQFLVGACQLDGGHSILVSPSAAQQPIHENLEQDSLQPGTAHSAALPSGFEQVNHVEQSSPLRDRAAICLADRVMALAIRRGGKLESLLQRRLSDPDFAEGSTFVVIQSASSAQINGVSPALSPETLKHTRSGSEQISPVRPFTGLTINKPPVIKHSPVEQSELNQWLDRGAVGWVASSHSCTDRLPKSQCKAARLGNSLGCQNLCFPARSLLRLASHTWPYLTHCTRALTGPMPQESMENYYLRLWQAGCNELLHPLGSLSHILSEARLRGSSQLTRGHWPLVSFSAVPLLELLSRRRFRRHLGRWDWEPYGLMILRQSLPSARPVIYGQSREFDRVPAEAQPYFQPLDGRHDWTQEKEWRVQGDVEFRQLPQSSVIVFVPTRTQALQLSRCWPYLVTWIAD